MKNPFVPAKKQQRPSFDFATVAAVHADGISLIFDGQSTPSEKRYRCNTAVTFRAGQRVKVLHTSGTWVVEYPVGLPGGGA